MKKQPGNLSDRDKEEFADELTDSLFKSEPLAQVIHDWIIKHQPSPMSVAFAGMVINKMMRQQVPGWDEALDWGSTAFEKMDESGILAELKAMEAL